jgi:hypothetical protein
MTQNTDRVLLAEGWMGEYDEKLNIWKYNENNVFLIENKNK